MAEISVAKETSVQEVNGHIGANTDSGASGGTTLFAKIKYIVTQFGTLLSRITTARMAKIDSIGSAADSSGTVSTGTLFAKANKIGELAQQTGQEPAGFITAAAAGTGQVTTILSEEDEPVSTSGSSRVYLGSVRISTGGVYRITAKLKTKAGTFFTPYSLIEMVEQTAGTIYYENIVYTSSTSAVTVSRDIFLAAGSTYNFYLKRDSSLTATVYVYSLTVGHDSIKEYMLKNSMQASATAQETLTPSSTSGSGTSWVTVINKTLSLSGSYRLTLTIPSARQSTTKIEVDINGEFAREYSSGLTTVFDINVKAGDVMTIKAKASDSDSAWGLTRATISYDAVPMGTNPAFVNTWQSIS